MSGDGKGGAAAAPAELFDGDGGAECVDPGAAVFLRYVQSKQAQGTHLADSRPVEFSGLVHLVGFGFDFASNEIMDSSAPHALFIGQVKVHGRHLLCDWSRRYLLKEQQPIGTNNSE